VTVAHLKSKLISYARQAGVVSGSTFAPNDEGERLRYAGYALYRRTADVWAVGDYDAWHFDGSAWTVPVPGAQFAADVHAGPGAVWAVGSYIQSPYSGGVRYPIGYRFTGTSWEQHHAADLDPGAFNGVAVRAADDVIAVGYSGQFTYALRWTGTEWQRLAAGNANPSPSSTLAIANVLLGVAHAGSTMWAVGYYYTGTGTEAGVQRTLVERYTC